MNTCLQIVLEEHVLIYHSQSNYRKTDLKHNFFSFFFPSQYTIAIFKTTVQSWLLAEKLISWKA